MYIPGAESANRGVLLSFLVKTYAKAKLLSESWGARPSGAGERRKEPEAYPESDPGNRNAHGPVLYRYGNTPGNFRLFGWKTDLGSAALPKNSFPWKGIRGCVNGPLAEIFFLFMEKQPELYITQIIREQQDTSGIYWDSLAS
jgi:hypothetical protein